jgi:hypothetical protein
MVAMSAVKKLSEPAWDALTEALAVFYWYKNPFETFIRANFADAPEILQRLNFGNPKRMVTSDLVRALRLAEVKYQPLVLDVLTQLAQFDQAFLHLAREEDGAQKVKVAQVALRNVRSVTMQYSELMAERNRLRDEFDRSAKFDDAQRTHAAVLTGLHGRFIAMTTATDPQQRGRDLEKLINELFSLFDMNPRASYSIEHEQIDGAFTCRTDDYLLEARWWKEPLGPKELNDFKVKVDGKARNTLGLCIAIGGFTDGAVVKHSNAGTPLVLMTGVDLMPILEGRLGLVDVLERKRRHASETGVPMFPVARMLA